MRLYVVLSYLCLELGVLFGLCERSGSYFSALCFHPQAFFDRFGVLDCRVFTGGDIPELFGPLDGIDFLGYAAVVPLPVKPVLDVAFDELRNHLAFLIGPYVQQLKPLLVLEQSKRELLAVGLIVVIGKATVRVLLYHIQDRN